MNKDAYSTPKADLYVDENIVVPEKILKNIKNAWIAGIISTVLTVILTLIALSGSDILGIDAYAFIDAFLMAIFTFGIYKKSRTCAIFMFLLFLANKILMWIESGTPTGLPFALIFLWFYTMGVVGTFQYHSFRKRSKAQQIAQSDSNIIDTN